MSYVVDIDLEVVSLQPDLKCVPSMLNKDFFANSPILVAALQINLKLHCVCNSSSRITYHFSSIYLKCILRVILVIPAATLQLHRNQTF